MTTPTPSAAAGRKAGGVAHQLGVQFGPTNKLIGVTSMLEAARLWQTLRDENDLGASDSPKVTVIDLNTQTPVATISYNARVWGMDGKEIAL